MSRRRPRRGEAAANPPGPSRRQFLQILGAASAAPWASTALPTLVALGAGRAAAQAPEKEETPPEVRHLLEIVKQRWGDRLDAEQLKAIERELVSTVRVSGTLRGLKLVNADEPDVIFRAEPPGEAQ